MLGLRPFICYYGGKWRTAPRYPAPEHDVIVEPFAGGAGYSLRYFERQVVLVEKDPTIATLWRYLINATAEDIMALPILEPGQRCRDTDAPLGGQILMGMWFFLGSSRPEFTMPKAAPRWPGAMWGERVRERIAGQVDKIKHWALYETSYEHLPNFEATWFVDPPYEQMGKYYKHGASGIDFAHLGTWCRERQGQTIVCEAEGASWLPFKPCPWYTKCSTNKNKPRIASNEAYWTSTQEQE